MRLVLTVLAVLGCAFGVSLAGTPDVPPGMVLIPGGEYKPLYAKEAKSRKTAPFFLDVGQATNGQYLEFLKARPEWRRSAVLRTQADKNYLIHWSGDLEPGPLAPLNAPVTHVSWFAARAYCAAQGKRLPTQDEWEFAARADATRLDATKDEAYLRQLLEWYSKPASSALADAGAGVLNVHGVRGLHGVVWEWVYDFNSTMIVGDSRGDGSLERSLFCGAGSLLAADVGNYAAYMRYALRSSLKGDYCVASLGFRAARSVQEEVVGPAAAGFNTIYELPGVWRTQDDKPLTLAQLKGKLRVVTMGFTSCKFACPRIIGDMKRIEKTLEKDAGGVGFVFFSFDTAADTPGKMKATQEEMKLDGSRWTFAVSNEETVRQLAVALDFKFTSEGGIFSHSNLIAVLDADGRVVYRGEVLGADLAPALAAIRNRLPPP